MYVPFYVSMRYAKWEIVVRCEKEFSPPPFWLRSQNFGSCHRNKGTFANTHFVRMLVLLLLPSLMLSGAENPYWNARVMFENLLCFDEKNGYFSTKNVAKCSVLIAQCSNSTKFILSEIEMNTCMIRLSFYQNTEKCEVNDTKSIFFHSGNKERNNNNYNQKRPIPSLYLYLCNAPSTPTLVQKAWKFFIGIFIGVDIVRRVVSSIILSRTKWNISHNLENSKFSLVEANDRL